MTLRGLALFSGGTSTVRFHRAPGGVRFRREGREIAADLRAVIATRRCTVLGAEGVRVALVEHLLAALALAGWWRELVIEVEGEELPILDGSAAPWCEALAELGPPPSAPKPFVATRSYRYTDKETHLCLAPGESALCAEIDFPHPAIGQQRWCGEAARYAELADARTFGFLTELPALRAQGLAGKASLEHAIVFDDVGPLQALRYPDEPVRHKALDALGDLFLVGRPLRGRLTVKRGSHAAHVAFGRMLQGAGGSR